MESLFEKYPKQLFKIYDLILSDSFSKNFWDSGNYKSQRIRWKDARRAKTEIAEFDESGIYIWGFEETPLYVGKAEKKPFASRFSRYVFQKKSQCNIAEIYTERISNGQEKVFVKELQEEFDISKSRALGAKIFGEIGAEKIWFILIPVKKESVTHIETELIYIAEKWNRTKGYTDLINLERIKKTVETKIK
jgi:hypothetical protein